MPDIITSPQLEQNNIQRGQKADIRMIVEPYNGDTPFMLNLSAEVVELDGKLGLVFINKPTSG